MSIERMLVENELSSEDSGGMGKWVSANKVKGRVERPKSLNAWVWCVQITLEGFHQVVHWTSCLYDEDSGRWADGVVAVV